MSLIENLPQEILLKILEFLEPKDLVQCLQVSKPFRRIAKDESLWQKLEIQDEEIPVKLINQVLSYGLKDLRIEYSDEYNQDFTEVAMAYFKMLVENVSFGKDNFKETSNLKFPVSQLKDFSFVDSTLPETNYEIVQQSREFVSALLQSCYCLERLFLTLENFCLNFLNFQSIARNGRYLKVLHLIDNTQEVWSLSRKEMKLIVDNCIELSELALVCVLDVDAKVFMQELVT